MTAMCDNVASYDHVFFMVHGECRQTFFERLANVRRVLDQLEKYPFRAPHVIYALSDATSAFPIDLHMDRSNAMYIVIIREDRRDPPVRVRNETLRHVLKHRYLCIAEVKAYVKSKHTAPFENSGRLLILDDRPIWWVNRTPMLRVDLHEPPNVLSPV